MSVMMSFPLPSVTAFGDSVMKGVVLLNSGCKNLPRYSVLADNFARRCADKLHLHIENHSKFGCTVRYGLDTVKRHEAEIAQSDYVVFEYGGNDCDYNWREIAANPNEVHLPRTSLDEFTTLYREMISFVKEKGSCPVLLSLPVLDDVRFFKYVSQGVNGDNILAWLGGTTHTICNWHEVYNLQVFRLGYEMHVPVVDITTPFLRQHDYRDYICEDGMHPNEKGHALIAATVEEFFSTSLTGEKEDQKQN